MLNYAGLLSQLPSGRFFSFNQRRMHWTELANIHSTALYDAREWSIGGYAILLAYDRHPDCHIHLFGFNWKGNNRLIRWEQEEAIARYLSAKMLCTIHPTDPCATLYQHLSWSQQNACCL